MGIRNPNLALPTTLPHLQEWGAQTVDQLNFMLQELYENVAAETGSSRYVHTQATAAATWIIVHNLGTTEIGSAFFMDDSVPRFQIYPDYIEMTDDNTLTIGFTPALAGKAVITV